MDTLQENLGQGVVPIDVYQKFEPAYRLKIAQLEEELEKVSHDSSNLENQVQKAIDLASNLLNFWKLLDYRWKRQLQDIVFPSGIQYFKQNEGILNPEINPIFSEMAWISRELENAENVDLSNIRWSAFKYSKLLWNGLLRTIALIDELSVVHHTIWKSVVYQYIDPQSGDVKIIENKYVSTTTGITQNLLQLPFSGTTNSHK